MRVVNDVNQIWSAREDIVPHVHFSSNFPIVVASLVAISIWMPTFDLIPIKPKTDKLFLRLWLLIRLLIKMQDCGRRHVDFTGNSNARQAWSEMISFIRKQNLVVQM